MTTILTIMIAMLIAISRTSAVGFAVRHRKPNRKLRVAGDNFRFARHPTRIRRGCSFERYGLFSPFIDNVDS
jgi:hypothetical protein